MWEEVSQYIKQTYEEESIRKIYLNADGGAWIKDGEIKREMLEPAIKSGVKGNLRAVMRELERAAETESQRKRETETERYLIVNWEEDSDSPI